MANQTLELTKQLIAEHSITPKDGQCQQIIAEKLSALNFKIEHLPFEDVKNLWATHGSDQPTFVFVGHTDVVPPGPIAQWFSNPFEPFISKEKLYGRGTVDMKSGLAAMIVAVTEFIKNNPNHKGTLAFLITSNEEGTTKYGTQRVVEHLQNNNQALDYCLVGEPSSEKILGDTIKIGRRGSLCGKLTIIGKQGHIAYPDLAKNPIHLALPALTALSRIQWDEGNEFFPPTSFQISNIHAGSGVANMIPSTLEVDFNFRYSTAVTVEHLKKTVNDTLKKYHKQFVLEWHHSGKPFLTTQNSPLIKATQAAIKKNTGLETKLSTAGGTSDGRFIAPTGCHVVELGPSSATAHHVNEYVNIKDLESLTKIYFDILSALMD